MKRLEMKEYNLDNNLNQNDESMIVDFFQYDDGYICDIISEIADNNVGMYNSDICENCWGLYSSGMYDEAVDSGLINGSDLIQNLQSAWYYYNEQQIYNNLSELVYNWAVEYINNNNIELTDKQMEVFENDIKNIDNNSEFSDIIELIENL